MAAGRCALRSVPALSELRSSLMALRVASPDSLATVGEHGGVFQCLEAMAVIGHDQHVAPRAASHDMPAAASRTRPCKISTVASPGFSCSARRAPAIMPITVWRKTFSCPPYTVSAVCRPPAVAALHLLTCQGLDGELLHGNSVPSRTDARVGGECSLAAGVVRPHTQCMPLLQRRRPLA